MEGDHKKMRSDAKFWKFSGGKQRRGNTIFDSNLVEGSIGGSNVEKNFCVQMQIWIEIVQRRKYNNNNIPCLKKIVFKTVQHNSVHNSVILTENQWIKNTMSCHY